MNTSYRINILKASFIISYLLLVLTAIKAWSATSEDCGENPFSTQIIAFEKTEDCYQVRLEVSHNNQVPFDLSHVNFFLAKGTISEPANSLGWKMEFLNKAAGRAGIKVDDIPSFGKDPSFSHFEVSFTYCPEDQSESIEVEYKAGQCIYKETLNTDDSESSPALNYEISAIPPSCAGNDGNIQITVTGGTEPYSISWAHGATGYLLEGLSAGIYSFTVTDGAGNAVSDDIALESPEAISITSNVVQPQCQGVNDGSIQITVEGGSSPYSFKWNNGSTDQNLTNLTAGIYSVEVTDINNCSATQSFTLSNETSLYVLTDVVQPSCQDGTAGSITLTTSGGTEPYTYAWSNGMETATVDNLTDGYYRVTVSDQSGCEFKRTIPIVTETGIEATVATTKANCFNDPVGAIDLTISSGTAPFTVEWSNGATSEDISGLTAGKYTATITDALGCVETINAYVLQNNIQVTYNALQTPSCSDAEDGSIDISVSNGTEPYSFLWSTGATTEDVSGLSGGKYTLSITDAVGCTLEKVINLSAPAPLQISYGLTQDICAGTQNISVNTAGGSPDYSYVWSDGSTGNQLIGVSPGTYNVTVTDSKSCSASLEIVVPDLQQPTTCSIGDLSQEVVCGSTGNILESTVTDATSYQWSVSSADAGWAITSSSDQSSIQFSSGSSGSSATFILNVTYEGGCEYTCEKTVDVCLEDPNQDNTTDDSSNDNNNDQPTDDGSADDGSASDGGSTGDDTGSTDGSGGDPGSDTGGDDGTNQDGTSDGDQNGNDNPDQNSGSDDGDPNGDQNNDGGTGDQDSGSDKPKDDPSNKDCDECFYTDPVTIVNENDMLFYTLGVSYTNCNYDLSHYTIEIPACFEIVEYSNSMNWKMELVQEDPTTGLSGIKVDDIPSFGKDDQLPSFEVYFSLRSKNDDCAFSSGCFAPTVAYKAATCVYYQDTQSNCPDDDTNSLEVMAYPNPTSGMVKVVNTNWIDDASYSIKLLDFQGEPIQSYFFEQGTAGDFDVDLSTLDQGIYLLNIQRSDGAVSTQTLIKY